MIETTAREFARNFAAFSKKAARGETVRITAPDGVFFLSKEARGITAERFLERPEGYKTASATGGVFGSEGGERIASSRRDASPARSPWQ